MDSRAQGKINKERAKQARAQRKQRRADSFLDVFLELKGWMFLSIIIAACVHALFYLDAPFPWLVATWSSGEILGYCGSIIGAFATIGAMVKTIHHATRDGETDRESAIKPLAVLTLPARPCEIPRALSPEERRAKDVGYASISLPILLCEDCHNEGLGVSYPEYINEANNAKILSALEAGWADRSDPFSRPDKQRACAFTRIELRNLGMGPAINLSVRLESEVGAIRQTYIGEHVCHSPVQQLAVGDGLSIGVYTDDVDAMFGSELVLVVKYEDCSQNTYEQRHAFMRPSEDGGQVCQLDLNISQVRV